MLRQKLEGAARIAAALDAGEPVQLVLVRRDAAGAEIAAVMESARVRDVPVRAVSARALWRLRDPNDDGEAPRSAASPGADRSARPMAAERRTEPLGPPEPEGRRRHGEACDALALVGPEPRARLEDVFAAGGAAWLLVGVGYPQNAGAAIRTAEVSGARGAIVDADFDHLGRRRALRIAMRADLFMPVCFEKAEPALERAAAAGFRTVGIEDVGGRAPWEVDLTGDVLFVAGGEAGGIPERLIPRCDTVVRLPMAGFIPAYNLQAAVAAVAVERLRQLAVPARRN